jgi:hypothetical protein
MLAKDLGIQQLFIRGDSQLVAKHAQKEYDYNNDKMTEYLAEVHMMEKFFDEFEVRYISHLDNHDGDHLAWITSSRAPTMLNVIFKKLTKPSVRPAKESIDAAKLDLMVIDESDHRLVYDWMSPIKMLLDN